MVLVPALSFSSAQLGSLFDRQLATSCFRCSVMKAFFVTFFCHSSAMVFDVTPFGALHSASRRKRERKREKEREGVKEREREKKEKGTTKEEAEWRGDRHNACALALKIASLAQLLDSLVRSGHCAHDHGAQLKLGRVLVVPECRFPRLPQVKIERAQVWRVDETGQKTWNS